MAEQAPLCQFIKTTDVCPTIRMVQSIQRTMRDVLLDLIIPKSVVQLMVEYADIAVAYGLILQFDHEFKIPSGTKNPTDDQNRWLADMAWSITREPRMHLTIGPRRRCGKTWFLARYVAVESRLLGTRMYVSLESKDAELGFIQQIQPNATRGDPTPFPSSCSFGTAIHQLMVWVECHFPDTSPPDHADRIVAQDAKTGIKFAVSNKFDSRVRSKFPELFDDDHDDDHDFQKGPTIVVEHWMEAMPSVEVLHWGRRVLQDPADTFLIRQNLMYQLFASLFPGRRILGLS